MKFINKRQMTNDETTCGIITINLIVLFRRHFLNSIYENKMYSGIQIARFIMYISSEFLREIATSEPCEDVIRFQYSLKLSNLANVTLP